MERETREAFEDAMQMAKYARDSVSQTKAHKLNERRKEMMFNIHDPEDMFVGPEGLEETVLTKNF